MPFGIGAETIRLIIGGIILVSSLMIGYFAPLKEKSVKANISFADPSFTVEALRDEGVGILFPATGWGEERYGKFIMDIMGEVITRDGKGLKIIPPNKGLELINKGGLVGEYALAKKEYESTGVWNKEFLKKIGRVMGVRYLIQSNMARFEHPTIRRSARVNVLGIRVLNTRESTIRLLTQIWDSFYGRVVWEGFIEVSVMDDTLRSKPVRFYEVARLAFEELFSKIPKKSVKISTKGERR